MIAFFRLLLYLPLYNVYIGLVNLIPGHFVAIAILVLTVLVRLVLTPFKHKAIESQARQKELAPELKEIQAKYKGDKTAQGQATMQFYKDRGVNPASGCLPLLVQFPIVIVLYYVFRTPIGPDHAGLLYPFVPLPVNINYAFFWIRDITQFDRLLILPVLAGGAQYLYSRSLTSLQPPPAGNDMASLMNKQMMFMVPIMTAFIGSRLPAALSLYWVIATLIDWYQQQQGIRRYQRKIAPQKSTISVRRKERV